MLIARHSRLALAASLFLFCAIAPAQPLVPKHLFIAFDGCRSDGLLTANTPNVDSLMDGTWGGSVDYNGAYALHCLTIQEPWAALHTGETSWSITHGVSWGLHMDELDQFPSYLETFTTVNPALDVRNVGVDSVADTIATTDVDAVFTWYGATDAVGHGVGFRPDAPQYIQEIQNADAALGTMLDAIRNRPNFANEDWQVVVTADHGGLANHGAHDADNETIPLVVTGRTIGQGQIAGGPIQYDIAATAIDHMLGPAAIPDYYQGLPLEWFFIRGTSRWTPVGRRAPGRRCEG